MAPSNKCFLVYALCSVPGSNWWFYFVHEAALAAKFSLVCVSSENTFYRLMGPFRWNCSCNRPILYAEMTSDRQRLAMRTHSNAAFASKFKFAKWGQISVACRRWKWMELTLRNDGEWYFRKQNDNLCMRMQPALPLMGITCTRFRFDTADTRNLDRRKVFEVRGRLSIKSLQLTTISRTWNEITNATD